MADFLKARNKAGHKGSRLGIILICLAIFTTICASVFAIRVLLHEAELSASRQELAALPVAPTVDESNLAYIESEMRDINPDYVGELRIDGSSISHPVVRGSDNVKYLTTSFSGAENSFGSLFMDYRCIGESIPHIIIYGHHARDMFGQNLLFGGLDEFLDDEYRSGHSVIMFIENDSVSEFEIFSARVTDVDDPAYHLNFDAPGSFDAFLERIGAPPDAVQIITLSTCSLTGDNDSRIVVQGARMGE